MPSRTADYVDHFFNRLRLDLAPGAEDVLRARYCKPSGPDQLDEGPGRVLGKMVAFLVDPKNAPRYFRPNKRFTDEGEPVLASILRRLPVGHESAKGLADDLHFELGHRPVEEAVEKIVGKLNERDGHHHLVTDFRPPEPPAELKIKHALRYYGPEIKASEIDRVAKLWAPRIGHRSPAEVLRKVSEYLAQPWHAEGLTQTGKPLKIDWSEPAFRPDGARLFNVEYIEKSGDTSAHDGMMAVVAQLPGI